MQTSGLQTTLWIFFRTRYTHEQIRGAKRVADVSLQYDCTGSVCGCNVLRAVRHLHQTFHLARVFVYIVRVEYERYFLRVTTVFNVGILFGIAAVMEGA